MTRMTPCKNVGGRFVMHDWY